MNVSGVTGVKSANEADVANFVSRIKKLTDIPVCSGFGIKSPEDAKKMAKSGCNGVIIGSIFVKYIQDNLGHCRVNTKFWQRSLELHRGIKINGKLAKTDHSSR